MEEGMKKCPACAEEIKSEAKKCRYCSHEIIEEIKGPTMTCSDCKIVQKKGNKECINCKRKFGMSTMGKIGMGAFCLLFIGMCSSVASQPIDYDNTNNTTSQIQTSAKIASNGNVKEILWKKQNYADEFGDKTDQTYISTKSTIKGTFSNSATEDSRLNVDIFVNSTNDIGIKLYEYAGKNAVKEYRAVPYSINIKDSKGNKHTIKGINSSEILKLQNSFKFHELLLEGGILKVQIVNDNTPTSKYNFTINTNGYGSLF